MMMMMMMTRELLSRSYYDNVKMVIVIQYLNNMYAFVEPSGIKTPL